MLKKSASSVLASLRGSTCGASRGKEPIRAHVIEARGSSELGMYLLASSLAATLLDGHFQHPEALTPSGRFDEILVACRA
jgi:hypothetical protein